MDLNHLNLIFNLNHVVYPVLVCCMPAKRKRWTAESNGLNPLIAVSPPEETSHLYYTGEPPHIQTTVANRLHPVGWRMYPRKVVRHLLAALAPPVGGSGRVSESARAYDRFPLPISGAACMPHRISPNAVGVTILKAPSVCLAWAYASPLGLPRPDSRRLIPVSQERYPAGKRCRIVDAPGR